MKWPKTGPVNSCIVLYFFQGDRNHSCNFLLVRKVSEIASREDSIWSYPDRPFAYRIASTLARWAGSGVCPVESMPIDGVHQYTSSESLQSYTEVRIIRSSESVTAGNS